MAIMTALMALDQRLIAALRDIELRRGSVVAVLTFAESSEDSAAFDPAAALKQGLAVQYDGALVQAEPQTATSENDSASSTGTVAGAVVGSIVGVVLLVGLVIVLVKRRDTSTAVAHYRGSTTGMIANPTYTTTASSPSCQPTYSAATTAGPRRSQPTYAVASFSPDTAC